MHNALIYSLPYSRAFYVLHQHDFGLSHERPDGSQSAVVRPFLFDEAPFFIAAEVHKSVDLSTIELRFSQATLQHQADRPTYEKLVAEARDLCAQESEKIVLSRNRDVIADTARWPFWMNALRQQFPHAFVYLLMSEKYGHWMGATPEPLVQQRGRNFSTVSLAGTKWGDEPFGEKERLEQQSVTEEIKRRLCMERLAIHEQEQLSFGEIRHLRTEISWTSDDDIITFASRLHPTPAVCGYPHDKALEFIMNKELRDRKLYTGYLGLVGHAQTNSLFVNLRCMQLFADRIRLYAGGGVTRLSDPEGEWEETERKMAAVLNTIKVHG